MKVYLIILIFFSLSVTSSDAKTSQPENPFLREFSESGELKLEFPSVPGRGWPVSLITYPIEFSTAGIKTDNLTLTDISGTEVPFQLSEIRLRDDQSLSFAKLNFFADFPANTKRSFVLKKGNSQPKGTELVTEEKEGSIIINTESLRIQVPVSIAKPDPDKPIPGPILAIDSGQGWNGASEIVGEKLKLIALQSNQIETGPLFSTYQLNYRFSGGGQYNARVRCIRNYPFVEISESFEGLTVKFSPAVVMSFTQFSSQSTKDAAVHISSDGKQQFSAAGPNKSGLTLAVTDPASWNGADSQAEINVTVKQDDKDSNNISILFPISSLKRGSPVSRSFALATFDVQSANDLMKSYPVHASEESNIKFGKWIHHHFSDLPLNQIKDWNLTNKGPLRPIRESFITSRFKDDVRKLLINAYQKSESARSLRSKTDWIEITETAYRVPNHPMSAEWFDQAESGLISFQKKTATNSNDYVHSTAAIEFLGSLRKGNPPAQNKLSDAANTTGKLANGSVVIGNVDGNQIILSKDGTINFRSGNETKATGSIATLRENKFEPVNRESTSTVFIDLGTIKFGSVSYPYPAQGPRSRKVLQIEESYTAVIDDVGTSPARWIWKDTGTPPPIFIGTDLGDILKANQKENGEHILEGTAKAMSGIAIIAAEKDLKVNSLAPKLGLQAAAGPIPNTVVLETTTGTDRLFSGNETDPIRLNGNNWAVDSKTGLIRELGKGNTELAVIGDRIASTHRIASEHMTLEVEGSLAAATARYDQPPQKTSRDPVVFGSSGNYSAPYGAKLRLNFGKPFKVKSGTRPRLLAFWKFDEGKGTETADLKNPKVKAKLIDQDPKSAWVNGIGFGKGKAIALNQASHVDTFYGEDLSGDSSIMVWVKTEGSGVLLSQATNVGQDLLESSRIIEITEKGTVRATLYGKNGFVLESASTVNDNKWHHIAWVSDEDFNEGLRKTLPNQHTIFVDAINEGTRTTNRVPNDFSVRTPLKIGGNISITRETKKSETIPGISGSIDNLRIYNFPITQKQIHGFTMVGNMRSPIAITSEPEKIIRVGQEFEYALEFTGGGPFVRFTFNNIPKWAKIEGRIIGKPTKRDIGLSKPITIVGMSPWGPGQQSFSLSVQPPLVKTEWKVQVNGRPVLTRYNGLGVEAALPPGSGTWRFTRAKPPMRPPAILKLENAASGLNIQLRGTPGVNTYQVESSSDEGKTWIRIAKGSGLRHTVKSQQNGKYLFRAAAVPINAPLIHSEPITLHLSDTPLSAPNRPQTTPTKGSVRLRWSAHVGATGYKVYQRKKGSQSWNQVYSGRSLGFVDRTAKQATPKLSRPGYRAAAGSDMSKVTIYEYCITAVDKNGESSKSSIADTDPRNW